MRRFIIAAIVGALVYTAGVAIEPFEGGPMVVFVPIVGLIFSTILLAVLFLPVRAALRRIMPHAARWSHAAVAGSLFLFLVALLTVSLPSAGLSRSSLSFAIFWG